MSSDKKIVVVTGFGPFGKHKVNASWASVQELAKIGLGVDNVQLIVSEVPVVYDEVKNIVPKLWAKYKPVLMVHVGVSGAADKLTLEQQAHNDGYKRNDVQEMVPQSSQCVDDGCDDVIVSGIDMAKVCDDVNATNSALCAAVSLDAGRYLCDFIYYTSLYTNRDITAFIHVPVLDAPYTVSEIAKELQTAICSMLKQVLH